MATSQGLPEVLISDIGMPGEDGYDLIGQVRVLPAEYGGWIPAVALTAYGRTQDQVQALAAGFQSPVAKPVEPVELASVVASFRREGLAASGLKLEITESSVTEDVEEAAAPGGAPSQR